MLKGNIHLEEMVLNINLLVLNLEVFKKEKVICQFVRWINNY